MGTMSLVQEQNITEAGFKPSTLPGFLAGGFKSTKRGFVFSILPDFSKISPCN